MFDELVQQARRLFSSKSNGGKKVFKITDRIHTYKQVFLALCIVLLLGYSHFRVDMECEDHGNLSQKTMTQRCLTNGTTTVINRVKTNQTSSETHAGMRFVSKTSDQVISHNYMRSYWPLCILLAALSFIASKHWASLFADESLKAVLQLTCAKESKLVEAVETAKLYETLTSQSRDELNKEMSDSERALMLEKSLAHKLDAIDKSKTMYDQALDYYPNQLTYLLLTNSATSYKLTTQRLRQKLIVHSLVSTLCTLMQVFLLLISIGNDFAFYGWGYLCAFITYLSKILAGDGRGVNSIDYELSAQIFPIVTQCSWNGFGTTGSTERIVVQCNIAMNEICAKLFAGIWWIMAVSLVIELITLAATMICSLNLRVVRWTFGLRFWPRARDQIDFIASFRHERSNVCSPIRYNMQARVISRFQDKLGNNQLESTATADSLDEKIKQKKLEASLGSFDVRERSSKAWYTWSARDVCVSVNKFICCRADKRRQMLECESERDVNIYYLLYLIYLRLGHSKSKTEEVIRMTAVALRRYLDNLQDQYDHLDSIVKASKQDEGPMAKSQEKKVNNAAAKC